ncbi:hypothetical protein FOQG_01206 [Fusarium oxysporum f. sp. raphani 54005]|uniref:AAA+ ATPase domain-containing protein n=2 Tax=Fusarium oxysporum f. sp. raphani TaxID=96318 RepID=X0D3V3_FUSOX|nr:hypothetical protein FOQG_01206 [Fusarium oxysporum f. sp. raphani 54005]KAG7429800.1 putative AAA family ATPase y4kL [Fusarium oxysporum f. sp. raphani]
MDWDGSPITDPGWGDVEAWNAVEYTQVEKPGLICEVKDAFAKFDYNGNFVKWLDEMPYGEVQKEIREIKRVRGKYAVVCGRFPTKDSTWEVRTIWINNSALQAVLYDVFRGHPDVSCGGEVLEFKAPFVPLIHRWEQLCKLAGVNAGSEIQKLMELFVDMLKNELRDTLSRVKRIKETGCASWEDLKFVFKPAQLFFRSEAPIAAGISRKYGGGHLSVHQIAWTGSDYSTVKSTFVVPAFHGTRPLSDLIVRPVWACPENDIKALKAALIRRGRKYEDLRGIHFRFHQDPTRAGKAQHREESSSIVHVWENQERIIPKEPRLPIQPTEGRVIVDADGCNDDWSRYVGPLYELNLHGAMKADGNDSKASTPDDHQESQEASDPKSEEGDDSGRLTDEEALLTVSTVNCFSIERKVWCYAEIDHLTDIEWNTEAINSLVIDEAEKRLLVGFVGATKNGRLQHFDDFVHGKGKGLVMLLCGPPGTGKTFTAESVSENLKRPLYRIDTSDLGMDTSKLECNLKTALDRCARWDAILLLDEAGVFLEKRTSSNLTQSEMTTIFLRLLEYYKGLMILTTNRYPAIDPAFESRIDLSFVFQDLEPASRAKIWYNFLIRENKKLAEDSNAIAKLASMPLNGRQIKSAVKTARILAVSENLPLAVDHLQTVVLMRMKALKMLE